MLKSTPSLMSGSRFFIARSEWRRRLLQIPPLVKGGWRDFDGKPAPDRDPGTPASPIPAVDMPKIAAARSL